MSGNGKINLLFITRKFPPQVGGMENLSWALSKEFSKLANLTTISWGGSQFYLPFFLVYAFLSSFYLIPTKKITHIHLGDALLSPLGVMFKFIFRVKVTTTVCGLDITFKLPPYQAIIPWFVSKLDKVICISASTKDECVKRGIGEEKCVVIPCGVYGGEFTTKASQVDLEKFVGSSFKDEKIIITVGRLVKRKGVFWFIKNVFPRLSKNYIYLVIGDGQQMQSLHSLVKKLYLTDRVHLMGKVSFDELKTIYNTANMFVMPNIKVNGDMEGFGIVALEASSCGLPVIASNLEGIASAIVNNGNGLLVEPKNVNSFLRGIKLAKTLSRNKVKEFTNKNFAWEKIARNYINEIS